MQSRAATVEEYLRSLPADRREAIAAVRKVFLDNLDRNYAEGMQYGMIGYYVPHSVFPPGYHCDPKQPLPFGGLASQKNKMSLYLMCLYGNSEQEKWFKSAWARTGKKLDMGKACIRFSKVEDLALEVIAEAIRRVPAAAYIARYQSNLAQHAAGRAARSSKPKPAKKPPAKRAGQRAKSSVKKTAKSRAR